MLKLIKTWLDSLPWGLVAIICLSLGLAPFLPPHVVEKMRMLLDGSLIEPIDWFDLALHGSPWLLLLAKTIRAATR
jgi:hypothetical protein